MTDPMQQHILQAMREQFNAYLLLLNSLSLQQRQQPLPNNPTWCAKDAIAHLWAWQQRSLARVLAAKNGGDPKYPPLARDVDEENLSEINQLYLEQYQPLPWQEVVDGWRHNYQQLIDEGDGLDVVSFLDSDRFAWLGGYAIADVYLGSYGHHAEHFVALSQLAEI